LLLADGQTGIYSFETYSTGFDHVVARLLDDQDDELRGLVFMYRTDGRFLGGGGMTWQESEAFRGSLLPNRGVDSITWIELHLTRFSITALSPGVVSGVSYAGYWKIITPTSLPEPGTLALLGLGLAGLGVSRRRLAA